MPENSASEQIYSTSQRTYQDQPVAKILESGPKAQSAFVASTETVTAVLTNIAKTGTLVSLPVGIILLNNYLRSEGAPLPAVDTSISVLLSLVCVIFLFITLLLASIFLLPTFAKIFSPAKPEAPTDLFQHKKKKSVGWQKAWQIVREYFLRFGPFLSFVLFIFVSIALFEKQGFHWIGATIGIVSFVVYCLVWHVTGYRKFNDVLQSSAQSLISFGTLFLLLLAVAQQVDPHMHAWKVALFCVGVPLVIHALMVTLFTDWKMALVFYVGILVVLSIVWPGLSDLGGFTLRYLGIGGNIPVSIRAKTYGRTGTVSGVDEMTGCLVLMTGGDVLIRPTPRVLDCKLHPQFMGGQSLATVETYSRVERYVRADVVRIFKFPESCSTVDGLPTC